MPSTAVLVSVLCVFGSLQGLLLAAALFSLRRERRRGNPLLGALLLIGSLSFGAIALSHLATAPSLLLALELLEYSLWFLVGPVLYLYVYVVTDESFSPRGLFLLHFLPAAAWISYLAIALALRGLPAASGGGPSAVWLPPAGLMVGYQVLYTALSIQRLADAGGDRRPAGLERFWARSWIGLMLALHAAQLARLAFSEVEALRDVVPLVGGAGFFVLTFLGIRRSGLIAGGARRRAAAYAGSSLTEEAAATIAGRLERLLDEERVHLDPELTLGGIAERLSAPRTHLSQVVNQRFGCGFLELVNRRRVEETRRLLADPESEHLTIEAIAFHSGFNSRSAFYEAFRRETGRTPSEYRDEVAGG